MTMTGRSDAAGERWRTVPGFGGRYQASDHGRVRKVLPDGSTRMLKPFVHRSGFPNRIRKPVKVRLIDPEGKKTERSLLSVVAETWFQIPQGLVPYHKNGLERENGIWNIGFCTPRELGLRFGHAGNERACCKVRGGTVLEYYRSAKAAAAANYMCRDAILDRCNGKVKAPYLPDGTSFRWDEPPRRGEKRKR